MAFGIRNVPDRSKALREFRRIMATDSPSTEGKTKGDPDTDGDNEKGSSVVAILELQNPESGVVAAVSRAFIRCALEEWCTFASAHSIYIFRRRFFR